MHLPLKTCTIRSLSADDASSIALHANNRNIWRNLRDVFPYPYSLNDAHEFLTHISELSIESVFAIDVDNQAVGTIGVHLRNDIERLSAELGYWLSESYWGQGIVTEAVRAFTQYSIEQYGLVRIEAGVFQWNPASCRVLEKAGYQREAVLRNSGLKDGQIIDRFLYAYVVDGPGTANNVLKSRD
jgi:ribosomal-protein-alanine N-acetyltransferase